jgi:hypothetical protein
LKVRPHSSIPARPRPSVRLRLVEAASLNAPAPGTPRPPPLALSFFPLPSPYTMQPTSPFQFRASQPSFAGMPQGAALLLLGPEAPSFPDRGDWLGLSLLVLRPLIELRLNPSLCSTLALAATQARSSCVCHPCRHNRASGRRSQGDDSKPLTDTRARCVATSLPPPARMVGSLRRREAAYHDLQCVFPLCWDTTRRPPASRPTRLAAN